MKKVLEQESEEQPGLRPKTLDFLAIKPSGGVPTARYVMMSVLFPLFRRVRVWYQDQVPKLSHGSSRTRVGYGVTKAFTMKTGSMATVANAQSLDFRDAEPFEVYLPSILMQSAWIFYKDDGRVDLSCGSINVVLEDAQDVHRDSKVYRTPLSNIHSNGGLCVGNIIPTHYVDKLKGKEPSSKNFRRVIRGDLDSVLSTCWNRDVTEAGSALRELMVSAGEFDPSYGSFISYYEALQSMTDKETIDLFERSISLSTINDALASHRRTALQVWELPQETVKKHVQDIVKRLEESAVTGEGDLDIEAALHFG